MVCGSVDTQLNTPLRFGSGTNRSRIAEVIGLRRLTGITLPGNGAPVKGSITTPVPLKSPARSAAEGTVLNCVIPFTTRVPSYAPKIKVRFRPLYLGRITGPPAAGPN